MRNYSISLPNFLVVGAYTRNAGKTSFTKSVILHSSRELWALKVTIIKEGIVGCPRGGEGCGVCTSLNGAFDIQEEWSRESGKDTSQLLNAGAVKVLWLRVRENSVFEGLEALLSQIPEGIPVICESNSLVKYASPGLFFLLKARGEEKKKQSAQKVEHKADKIIETTPEGADFDLSKIDFDSSRGWFLRS